MPYLYFNIGHKHEELHQKRITSYSVAILDKNKTVELADTQILYAQKIGLHACWIKIESLETMKSTVFF